MTLAFVVVCSIPVEAAGDSVSLLCSFSRIFLNSPPDFDLFVLLDSFFFSAASTSEFQHLTGGQAGLWASEPNRRLDLWFEKQKKGSHQPLPDGVG